MTRAEAPGARSAACVSEDSLFGACPRDLSYGGLSRGRSASSRAVFQMSVEPLEHGVIPLDAVGWLQHKVIFVRKYQQLALDASALQRGERTQPLGVGDAEVLLAVHDE